MDRSLRQPLFIIDEGSKPEILSRKAQTIAALTRLKPVWNDRSISPSSKIHRYTGESWTLTAEL